MEKEIGGRMKVVVDITPKNKYSKSHPIRLEIGSKGPNVGMTLEESIQLRKELGKAELTYKAWEKRADALDTMEALACDVAHAIEALQKVEHDSSHWDGAISDLSVAVDELIEYKENLEKGE